MAVKKWILLVLLLLPVGNPINCDGSLTRREEKILWEATHPAETVLEPDPSSPPFRGRAGSRGKVIAFVVPAEAGTQSPRA